MNKNYSKFAFTMAEMLVCLSVISIIATILIPTLGRLQPNKTKTMFKKTYQVAERVVYELVNDNVLYYDASGVVGFDNVGEVIYNGVRYGSDYVANTDDENYDEAEAVMQLGKAKSKFCYLFASKLNTTSLIDCRTSHGKSFSTTDGVDWYMPITNFTNGSSPSPAWKYIIVDVNGPKPPNVYDDESANAVCNTDDIVDRFKIYIRADGLMAVRGVCARDYINSANIAKNKEETHKTNSDMQGIGLDIVTGDPEDSSDGSNHVANSETGDDENYVDQTGSGDTNP